MSRITIGQRLSKQFEVTIPRKELSDFNKCTLIRCSDLTLESKDYFRFLFSKEMCGGNLDQFKDWFYSFTKTFRGDNFIKKSECSSKVETKKNNQVGGTHYSMPIQPIEYIVKNDLGFREGNIIKYVTRYPYKNGLEDLLKAQDYLNMLIKEQQKEINNEQ